MNVIVFRIVLLLFACLISFTAALRAGEDLIEVTAAGIGKDSDDAQKNALRDAVEQAVGTLVDSKIMVENDEVISDTILSHSGGFVKRHKIIEGPTAKDGLVEVRIRAWVQRTQLAARLEAEKVVVKKVDGLTLGDEAAAGKVSRTRSREMLQELLKDFPGDCVTFEVVGDPVVDALGEKVTVTIRNSVNREATDAFLSRFDAYLEQTAVKKHKNERTAIEESRLNNRPALIMQDYLMRYHFNRRAGEPWEYMVGLLTRVDDNNAFALWKVYGITKESSELLDAHLKALPAVTVEILGGDGETIDSRQCTVDYPFKRAPGNSAISYFFLPFFASGAIDGIVMPGPMEYSVTFDNLFPDEIRDIHAVRIGIGK